MGQGGGAGVSGRAGEQAGELPGAGRRRIPNSITPGSPGCAQQPANKRPLPSLSLPSPPPPLTQERVALCLLQLRGRLQHLFEVCPDVHLVAAVGRRHRRQLHQPAAQAAQHRGERVGAGGLLGEGGARHAALVLKHGDGQVQRRQLLVAVPAVNRGEGSRRSTRAGAGGRPSIACPQRQRRRRRPAKAGHAHRAGRAAAKA